MLNKHNQDNKLKYLLFFIFSASGFSGLIYESIWSHYLKLFLGHAAFAQTLVLVIFMGGMAIGAWLASKYSIKWRNPFLAYAIIEGIIGLFAITFHTVFVESTSLAYSTIMPALGSGTAVGIFKWSLAGLLILPQSILLGSTFPLMSSGIIRKFSDAPGFSLSMLYFTNSLGAAIGVLISGFVLIGLVGLPGTVLFAGLLNIILAILVWAVTKDLQLVDHIPTDTSEKTGNKSSLIKLMLFTAMITGAASFMYEIGWIRMLSLVLGSSTHAFEMMLSAFITGLAFGGFWIKKRIDTIKQPIIFLGMIQIVMGFMALATIPLYNSTFDIMAFTIEALSKTEPGYALFNFISHFISFLIMFPAAFCAGMTLPLITHTLIKNGDGEKAIGRVYAANTAGSIIGIIFAVNIGMPLLALKGLISFGVMLDILIGIYLIYYISSKNKVRRTAIISFSSILIFVLTSSIFAFDEQKMTSGVYRHGNISHREDSNILFNKDGKTATVSIIKSGDLMTIRTNGKPDAGIRVETNKPPTSDEPTMILAGAIPMTYLPKAKHIANIGFGSGLTGHTILGVSTVAQIDTIEIEPLIYDAAKYFGSNVERVYKDPRSKVFFDDAKSFFTTHQKKYDIIISEPSNPWVSGISSLFTKEWYEVVRNHMTDDGLYAQWIHLYETDINIIASVIKAISPAFGDYAIYNISSSDALIIATKKNKLPEIKSNIFEHQDMRDTLNRIGINNLGDIRFLKIGDKKTLDFAISNIPAPVNSDYFPYLDLHAVKTRYLGSFAKELLTIRDNPLPLYEMLHNINRSNAITKATQYTYNTPSKNKNAAILLREQILNEKLTASNILKIQLNPAILNQTNLITSSKQQCEKINPETLITSLLAFSDIVIPYLSSAELTKIWNKIKTNGCMNTLENHQDWFDMVLAISDRNGRLMAKIATKILTNTDSKIAKNIHRIDYLVAVAMLGHLSSKENIKAFDIWKDNLPKLNENSELSFIIKYMAALSVEDRT